MPRSRRLMRPEDHYALRQLSDPQLSPDGAWVACVITQADREQDRFLSDLWLFSTDGKQRLQLTNRLHRDGSPRWSPQGDRLAFVAPESEKEGAKSQLWVIPIAGGEAKRVTRLKQGAGSPVWSPDGKALAFTATQAKGEKGKGETKFEVKAGRVYATDVKVIETLRYRPGPYPAKGDGAQIYVVPATGGKPRRLTEGDYNDGEPTWSPDGKHLAFVSNRGRDGDVDLATDVWVVPVAGGKPRRVTTLAGGASNPVWSADSKTLAFVASDDPGVSWTTMQLWAQPLRGGEARCLSASLDSLPHSARWAGDGVVFLCDDDGCVSLWRAGLEGVVSRVLPKEFCLTGYGVAAQTGALAYLRDCGNGPAELFCCDAAGGKERQLSHENRAFTARYAFGEREMFRARTWDGKRVQGWVVKPPHMRAGRTYPLVLQVHGGPYGAYTAAWKFDAEALAAAGYVVVYCNPRGSTGYGRAWTQAVTGQWGLADARDCLAAVDHVVKQGYVDKDRLAVSGGSYGGFMTTWLLGNCDRFKAGIAYCAVTDVPGLYFGSDIPVWLEKELGGKPWERPEAYTRISPTTHGTKIQAPLLLLHADDDVRVPIGNSEMLHTMLKRLGREVVFVRYPSGGHGFSGATPRYLCDSHNRRLDWLAKHVKG